MHSFVGLVLICLLAAASSAFAQRNPFSESARMTYGVIKDQMLSAAEKMPEERYTFKPAKTERTYGEIVGQIADLQYAFCSVALGEKMPAPSIEQTKISKTDLIPALKDAIAYCDRAYNSLNDATALQSVRISGTDMTRASVLNLNIAYSALLYDNLKTYMRLNNIVPPSSEPGFARPVKK
jgi:DinB family protein